MKIIALQAENVKRLQAVEIKPDGKNLVIVGGMNGNGKTSVLDSIWYGLGGRGSLPPKPVREGAEEAVITLDLGEYRVTRTIKPDGTGSVKLTNNEGARYPSPQTILDGLVGNLSFDPLEFSRMDDRKQLATLKQLVNLDFTKLDMARAGKVEERLLVGREVKNLQGQLAGLVKHEGVPDQEFSVSDLTLKLQQAQDHNHRIDKLEQHVQDTVATLEEWKNRVVDLRKELADAEGQVVAWEGKLKDAETAANAQPRIDTVAIVERIGQYDEVLRKVRENKQRAQVQEQLAEKQKAYEAFTQQIEAIDAEKEKALAGAKFPVKGLSFNETGVLVNGVPFKQASGAEQLRISVAMGIALNPRLKVLLVRDGSLLDSNSLELVARMAAEHDAQVWLERVGTGDENAIIIEDGKVKTARKQSAGV